MNDVEKDKERILELQLFGAIRNTKTLIGDIPLYKNASISLRTFDPKELYPTVKYVLTDNLLYLSILRDQISKTNNVDIFNLNQIYYNSICNVIGPPIVELSDNVPTIIDGLHRCTLAMRAKKQITVVYIENVDLNYPIISTPVNWNEVIEYQKRPDITELIRNLRPGINNSNIELEKYYRNFNYLGSVGRRPRNL